MCSIIKHFFHALAVWFAHVIRKFSVANPRLVEVHTNMWLNIEEVRHFQEIHAQIMPNTYKEHPVSHLWYSHFRSIK